ncbi:hypothetical protein ACOMHN_006976 [Nucella lapillus]
MNQSSTDINVTATEKPPENVPMTSMDIIYVTLTTVSSSLSIVGSIVIIGTHIAYRNLRTTGRAMLVQLSVADMLTALGNLLGVLWYLFRDSGILNHSMAYCVTQSAWTIFSSIASFLWTVAIAVTMCVAIVRHRPSTADRNWKVFVFVCWGLPAVVTVIALSCGVLGYDSHLNQASWCWIDPGADHPLFWTFFTGKAWELVAFLVTLVLFSAIRISLIRHKAKTRAALSSSKRGSSSSNRSRRDVIHDANVKLTFVPFVFIVLRVWGTVRFLLAFTDHDYASSSAASWIVPLQGFGDSLQGFANFVMYCFFTRTIRNRLFRCCLRGNQVNQSISADNPQDRSLAAPAAAYRHAGVSSVHVISPATLYANEGTGTRTTIT